MIGNQVLSVSAAGVLTSDLGTLAPGDFTPFPTGPTFVGPPVAVPLRNAAAGTAG